MRFRLRTLLIAITAVCIALVLWPLGMRQLAEYHRRRASEIYEDYRRTPNPAVDVGWMPWHLSRADFYEAAAREPWIIVTKSVADFPHHLILSDQDLEYRLPIELPEE